MSAPVVVRTPRVLLPKASVDAHRWAVIACDQFTSQPEYWAEVEKVVGDAPSTLRMKNASTSVSDSAAWATSEEFDTVASFTSSPRAGAASFTMSAWMWLLV